LLAAGLAAYLSRRSWARLRPAVGGSPLLLLALLFLFCWFPTSPADAIPRIRALLLLQFAELLPSGPMPEPSGSAPAWITTFLRPEGSSDGALDLAFIGGERVGLTVRNGRRKLLAARAFSRARLRVSLSDLEEFSLGKRRLVHSGWKRPPA